MHDPVATARYNDRVRPSILGIRSYPDVVRQFTWGTLWELFDGDRERLNLAHECVDRHADAGTAVRIQHADGQREAHTFAELSDWSSRFANFLEAEGIERGDRVAIMLEPSLAFYGALFGTLKRGAVAVPLFTLFGPDALALRLDDCQPRMMLVPEARERSLAVNETTRVVAVDQLLFE